jgi:predicted aminopeptidase
MAQDKMTLPKHSLIQTMTVKQATTRCLLALSLVTSLLLLAACNDGSYLWQCAMGQWNLMSRAKPIEEILEQQTETPEVREQLAKVVKMREFAVSALSLPDNGSYHKYADLGRPYAVWNLVAAPELSIDLNQWCYPIAGCVTYHGYFDEASAHAMAEDFTTRGFDVDIYGVKAYSTLKWFDDPVLNTFLTGDDLRLAALLFHEMAHQVVYVPNDTAFNESFARTVEREGLRRWLQSTGSAELWQTYLQREEKSSEFRDFIARTRNALGQVYASDLGLDEKRQAKRDLLQKAVDDYAALKESWNGYSGFDAWMQRGLNNARLSSVAIYNDLVPSFEMMLARVNNDLPAFYADVKKLGKMPATERLTKLKSYSKDLKVALTN